MKIWLDTANIHAVQKAVKLGILSGVTTNPTIISNSKRSFEDILEDLLHYQEGTVAVQVVAESATEMIQQGKNLFSFSNRIIVKVPATKNGYEAIHNLSRKGIPTMATVVFTPQQALLAMIAGADYIAPYLKHIEKTGLDPWVVLSSITKIIQNYRFKTKVLCASIEHVEQILKCAEYGIQEITIKETLFEQMLEENPHTLQRVSKFNEDWKEAKEPQMMLE